MYHYDYLLGGGEPGRKKRSRENNITAIDR